MPFDPVDYQRPIRPPQPPSRPLSNRQQFLFACIALMVTLPIAAVAIGWMQYQIEAAAKRAAFEGR